MSRSTPSTILKKESGNLESQRCPDHPDTETYLTCSNCGRPICPRCMVPTPVGAKCPDCARHRGRTAGQAKPIYYVRAIGAGLGAAVLGGIVLGVLIRIVAFGSIILTFLVGMAMGEIVSRAARRNTGPAFQLIAGASAALMFFIAGFFTGFPVLGPAGFGVLLFRPNPILWLLGVLGTYLATLRLK